MAFLDPIDLEFNDDDDLSTTIGTETLAANDLILEGPPVRPQAGLLRTLAWAGRKYERPAHC
jgi:hypothetical protein